MLDPPIGPEETLAAQIPAAAASLPPRAPDSRPDLTPRLAALLFYLLTACGGTAVPLCAIWRCSRRLSRCQNLWLNT
jgi:hypothetical protein